MTQKTKTVGKGLFLLCLLAFVVLHFVFAMGRSYPAPTQFPDAVWSTEDGSIEFFVSEKYLHLDSDFEADMFGTLRANGKEYPVIVTSSPEFRSTLFFTSLDILDMREEVEQGEGSARLWDYHMDYTILILDVRRGLNNHHVSATVNPDAVFDPRSETERLKQQEANSVLPIGTKLVLHRKDDPAAVATAYEQFRAAYVTE